MLYQYNRIIYFLNGKRQEADIAPGISALHFIHQELGLHGTKCSCNEGDCGACTVCIVSKRNGKIVYEAINSCLYSAARLHGKHLITIEGIGTADHLHPVQQAMLDFHATQCGYCSPGFVMSAFAMLAMNSNPSREDMLAALEGNLCRCTGYDSIYNAINSLCGRERDFVPRELRAVESELADFEASPVYLSKESASFYPAQAYHLPQTMDDLNSILSKLLEHGKTRKDYSFICGGTDIMVQVNIGKQRFGDLIDTSYLKEFHSIELEGDTLCIGAGVSYDDLMRHPVLREKYPYIMQLFALIASKQIRNSASIAGNIANASPIGDILPLLLVLEAELILASGAGERSLPLKDYFLAYKQTALQNGEYIFQIRIVLPGLNSCIHSIKSAKRKSVDISAISSAIRVDLAEDAVITKSLLAFGGAAAIPKLCDSFDLRGRKPEDLDVQVIADAVAAEFTPLSDVRGSAAYRKKLIKNHVIKYFAGMGGH